MKRAMTSRLLGFSFATVIFLSLTISLSAQSTGSRGKDFWLAFMPNFHPNGHSNDPRIRLEDSLYIYIAATSPTQAKISYPNPKNGNWRDTVLTISNTSKVYSFSVPWEGYELEGFNNSGQFINGGQNETPATQTFHVTSEKDISVYALNQARTTSDAFLVLPTPVLGVDHYVMSYNSDGFFDNFNSISTSVTPSQFVIVAAHDNTQIKIMPSAPTFRSGSGIKTTTLNAGEAYLAQAQITYGNLRGDLTGTHIISSKPVAVFGGHQRATLPLEYRDRLTSRDCLIEQIPSVEVWGKSAFLAPYPAPKGATSIGTDLFRVMAAFDSTPIYLNGDIITMLGAGQFYEGKLVAAGTISSVKPILVAQFKKTSGEQGGGGTSGSLRLGDPFMMLIPPAEQFLSFYRCINAQAWELPSSGINRPSPVYENQYITVVSPNSAITSVKIDGKAVQAPFFTIPNSTYSYAWEPVQDGAHTVEADEPIGIYVYGYGLANSYGYVGDMNFRAFDYSPPQIRSEIKCFEIKGAWYDSTRGDTRIKSVVAPPDSQINMSVFIESFIPYKDSVAFTATLNDIYNDGLFVARAEDSVGLISYAKIDAPGFTLRAEAAVPPNAHIIFNSDAPVKKEFCSPIKIENYGKFPQSISGLRFHSGGAQFYSSAAFPIIIPPGSVAEISVCFYADKQGKFIDTVDIFNDCAQRTVGIFDYIAKSDTLPPQIARDDDPCGTQFVFDVAELSPIDLGLDDISLIDSATRNCSLTVERNANNTKARVVVKVVNIYKDAYFLLRIADSAGNQRLFSDTISGLTVTITTAAFEPPNSIIYFDTTELRSITCNTATIFNYGKYPLYFRQISPVINTLFSTPQTQFPISLSPGEQKKLIICYSPVNVKNHPDFDTLRFSLRCLSRDFILQGSAAPIMREGEGRCNISVISRASSIPSAFYLDGAYPNPIQSGESMKLKFGLPSSSDVDLSIFDSRGIRVMVILSGAVEGGEYEAEFVTDRASAGLYCAVLRVNGVVQQHLFLVQ